MTRDARAVRRSLEQLREMPGAANRLARLAGIPVTNSRQARHILVLVRRIQVVACVLKWFMRGLLWVSTAITLLLAWYVVHTFGWEVFTQDQPVRMAKGFMFMLRDAAPTMFIGYGGGILLFGLFCLALRLWGLKERRTGHDAGADKGA